MVVVSGGGSQVTTGEAQEPDTKALKWLEFIFMERSHSSSCAVAAETKEEVSADSTSLSGRHFESVQYTICRDAQRKSYFEISFTTGCIFKQNS